jgi:hypothetical protein
VLPLPAAMNSEPSPQKSPDRSREAQPDNQRENPIMKQTKSSKPDYAVYVVEGEGDNAYWTKIGSAWSHKDGEGVNITLNAFPVNGKLTVRKPKAERDDQ